MRTLNRRHKLAVLALDYRGYGKSEGKPSEQGLYQDARAARRWLAEKEQIAEGDVIRAVEGSGFIRVLYRRGANSNSLFATERCNSYCLMCSQPPKLADDSYRVGVILRLLELIDRSATELVIRQCPVDARSAGRNARIVSAQP